MEERYIENGFHSWFIKTWEGLSCMSWMHLRCGNNPKNKQNCEHTKSYSALKSWKAKCSKRIIYKCQLFVYLFAKSKGKICRWTGHLGHPPSCQAAQRTHNVKLYTPHLCSPKGGSRCKFRCPMSWGDHVAATHTAVSESICQKAHEVVHHKLNMTNPV